VASDRGCVPSLRSTLEALRSRKMMAPSGAPWSMARPRAASREIRMRTSQGRGFLSPAPPAQNERVKTDSVSRLAEQYSTYCTVQHCTVLYTTQAWCLVL